jgi:hypothetical protein
MPEWANELVGCAANGARLGRHTLVGELAEGRLGFVELEVHCAQDLRRFGKLNIAVLDDLDAIAPRIEKIEEWPRQQTPSRRFDPLPHARTVIDDEARNGGVDPRAASGFPSG